MNFIRKDSVEELRYAIACHHHLNNRIKYAQILERLISMASYNIPAVKPEDYEKIYN